MTRIVLVAGEVSGDLLAAHLIEALKHRLPGADFCGIAGPKMQRAGCNAWWPAEKLAVRGYAEVLRHYGEITGIRKALLGRLLADPPDLFIGVDAPDFNLWLETRLKRAGIRAVHYVSPSVWAWRGNRVNKIARACDHLLALFPFEPALYERVGLPVTYVGHPLADLLPVESQREAARERLGLTIMADSHPRKDGTLRHDCSTPTGTTGPIFALLPGSRQSEVACMAATFIQTVALLRERFPGAHFLVPLATRETREIFEAELWARGAREWPIKLLFGHAQDALAACDAALVASGTATLEAALLKAPLVVTYRMSPWSWFLMKRMRYQPSVGLPNILAGRFVVPEFLQDEATPEKLAEALAFQATDADNRRQLVATFTAMHEELRQNTAEKAADAILAVMRK